MKTLLFLFTGLLLLTIACEQDTSKEPEKQQLALTMPNNNVITVSFGDPIIVSARGTIDWRQEIPHGMSMAPRRLAANPPGRNSRHHRVGGSRPD